MPVSPVVRGGLLIAVLAVGIGPAAGMKRLAPGSAKAAEALDLNAIVLVLSMIFVPIGFAIVAALFHRDLHVGAGAVAKVVLGRALLPLLLGLGAARLSPRAGGGSGTVAQQDPRRSSRPWSRLRSSPRGSGWPMSAASGGSTALALAVGAVIIGHLLGGPNPESRGVVAAASAMRFPALALVLAAALPEGQRVIPVVLAYVLAAFAATTVYGVIMSRRGSKHETPVVPIGAAPRHA